MIRGKYLRERKAIRVKRRMKLLTGLLIVFIIYKILFSSYSLFESEASSTADIDVAFYLVEDEYETKTITLEDMLPGDTQYAKFTISNYYIDENNQTITSETDMECNLKIRTTTNLPLKYELYINQDTTSDNLQNRLELETTALDNIHWDAYDTMFKHLVLADQDQELKNQGITDKIDFKYSQPLNRTYILKVEFPKEYSQNDNFQNIMECIEITVDSKQVID